MEERVNLFKTIREDPDFDLLSPTQQAEIRESWINQQQYASGKPRDQKLYMQLVKESYYDLPQEAEKPSKFWWGGEPFPAGEEYAPRMLKFVDRLGRVFSAPQQFLQSAFRRPPDQPLTERIVTPFAETGAGLVEDILGAEERELKYPYTMYTDPLLLGGVTRFGGRLLKKGIRSAEELAKRVRAPGAKAPSPMTGEAAEAFNRAKLAEEAARREALRATVREAVPPTRLAAPPLRPAGAPIGPGEIKIIKNIRPKLAPHYSADEIKTIRDFVLQHPEDVITKSLTSQKKLSPELTKEINQRIFFRRPTVYKEMPTFKQAGERFTPKRARVKPPSAAEPSIPENLNDPTKLAEELRKLGD